MIYPWQTDRWTELMTAWQMSAVPQSLLLTGQAGIGKQAFAKALAGFLLCQQPVANAACGYCRACELLKVDSHPDLLFIGLEDKAHTIKVDQIRALSGRLGNKAQQGHYQVAIIDSVDLLTHAAANSLLKTLEEPSTQVVLLLIYHQTVSLMPTIATRCQKLRFQTPTQEEATRWLSDQLGEQKSEQSASELLAFSGGAPLKALAMAQTEQLAISHCLFRLLTQQPLPEDETKLYALAKSEGLGTVLDVWMCLMSGALQEQLALPALLLSDYWQILLDAKQDFMRGKGSLNPALQCQALLIEFQQLYGVKSQTTLLADNSCSDAV